MRETAITAKLVQELNKIQGCRAKKRHGGRYQSGDPDVSGVIHGKAFFIEVKKSGGELTELQALELERWRRAGALVVLAAWQKPIFALKWATNKLFSWQTHAGKIPCTSSPYWICRTPMSSTALHAVLLKEAPWNR